MEGADVLAVQKALGLAGYTIVADGKFGRVSESVIKQFQKNSGLAVNGTVDQATREALGL